MEVGWSSTALTDAQTCTSWKVPGLTTIDISDGDMMIVPLLLTFAGAGSGSGAWGGSVRSAAVKFL